MYTSTRAALNNTHQNNYQTFLASTCKMFLQTKPYGKIRTYVRMQNSIRNCNDFVFSPLTVSLYHRCFHHHQQ